jgi:hypothetical protein
METKYERVVEHLRIAWQRAPQIVKLLFGVGDNGRAHEAGFDDNDLQLV